MNRNVIITCAITGAGATTDKSEHVPVTPEQIADSAIEAARAGAAIVHCHVRDPETGKGSRNPDYYEEVVKRIREKDSQVIINLTAGMGGDLVIGPDSNPMDFGEGTDENKIKAFEWYEKSAHLGNCDAMNCVGMVRRF